jgi:hypothetical protein
MISRGVGVLPAAVIHTHVMPALDTGTQSANLCREDWIAGSSPAMTTASTNRSQR